jgi:protease-4
MRTLFRVFWRLIKLGLLAIGLAVVVLLLWVVFIGGVCPSAPRVADKSVLIFDLSTRITDRPSDERASLLVRLLGETSSTLQLRAATTALREAAQDKRISAIYLHGNLIPSGYSSGYGALKELRDAIRDFQKSGKPVIAYIGDADNRDYYVMSVADQILLNPFGMVAFRGLVAGGMFYKGAEDKYGVEFTAIRHGKYKSAVEPFTRENLSPENREQLQALVGSIWSEMLNAVALSRKMPPGQLQALIDKEGLIEAPVAKAQGLITEVAYETDALDKLRKLTATTAQDKPFPQVSLADYAPRALATAGKQHRGKDKIAIVYAEGVIIDGYSDPDAGGVVPGDGFARMLRKVRQREDVKAVVLRVNSPGGSAGASMAIAEELRRFKSDRPVIISMGTVAASGGYAISMPGRRILAEPNTITGSIGVFGLMVNLKKLASDHGVTYDVVQTGALADLGTLARPMTPEEHTVIQNLVDRDYDDFIRAVARSRNLTTNRVDEIAQGRVWSGADAAKIGLVDDLGGLEQAISFAANDAKLGTNYSLIEYPERKGLAESLAEALSGGKEPLTQRDVGSRIAAKVTQTCRWFSTFNDPHGIYTRLPFDLELN